MNPTERRQKIIALLEDNNGVLSITDLMAMLNVSHMTVRRDLQLLEQNSVVTPVTGGVQLIGKLSTEPSHKAKEILAADEKNRIGKAAARLIPDHSCIYLDAGTTSLALAHYITEKTGLTIVTNDFEVLNYLIERTDNDIIHVGGLVLHKNRSTVGQLATKIIRSLSVDLAFMSASSFDSRNVTTPDMNKVVVKQAVMEVSRRKILICDSSKYAQIATYVAFPLSELNTVITDKNLPQSGREAVTANKVELIAV